MGRENAPTGERKTRRAIVKLLKLEGPLGTAQLAERLGLTAMAVRLHLYALQGEGLVAARQRSDYAKRIRHSDPLKKRLAELARVRTEEGYMAEVRAEKGGGFLLVENHCPICAAANACQGFCSTELELFRAALGPGVEVERVEHIVSGDRRCAYRVKPSAGKRRKPSR